MESAAHGLDATAKRLASGGVAVYPTETLYAIGCDARDANACARVAGLKGRPEAKPFPLIVADMAGLSAVAEELPPDLLLLAERFWPGPLSVLVRTKAALPASVRDATGFSSIRMSPHPTAQELCRRLGFALVATSANKSGRPATALPGELDPELLAGADSCLLSPPLPGGGAPSTLVRLLGTRRVQVLRAGAVPVSDLADLFEVLR